MEIFVYGTLKKGGKWHHIIEKKKFIGHDLIKGEMYLDSKGYYPILFQGEDTISGEVYEIDQNIYKKVYALESGADYIAETAETNKGRIVTIFLCNNKKLKDPSRRIAVFNAAHYFRKWLNEAPEDSASNKEFVSLVKQDKFMNPIILIANKIKNINKRTILIGIDGGQGSGKSTFIKEVGHYCLKSNQDHKIIFLETDDFLVERDKREDLSASFFKLENNLRKLFDFKGMAKTIKLFQRAKNKTIILNNLYNTETGKRNRLKKYIFGNKNIVLIGGPYLLQKSYPKFDIKIFLYATKGNRLRNTLSRILTRQRSANSQKKLFNNFEHFYKPYYLDRLSKYDLIVDNNDFKRRRVISKIYAL